MATFYWQSRPYYGNHHYMATLVNRKLKFVSRTPPHSLHPCSSLTIGHNVSIVPAQSLICQSQQLFYMLFHVLRILDVSLSRDSSPFRVLSKRFLGFILFVSADIILVIDVCFLVLQESSNIFDRSSQLSGLWTRKRSNLYSSKQLNYYYYNNFILICILLSYNYS